MHITSARWEDFGQAQLEALADGALLATTPAGGPFEALAFARELAPRLVAADISPPALATAIRAAFAVTDDEAGRYRQARRRRASTHTARKPSRPRSPTASFQRCSTALASGGGGGP